MMGEKEINDSGWATKLSQIKDRPDIKKSVELLVIISRTGYDSHTRPFKRYYLQRLRIFIPTIEEFAPFYLSLHEFQTFKMRGQGIKSQKLYLHRLDEGSTQPIGLDNQSLAFAHARLEKAGREKPIEAKKAVELVKSGRVYKVVPNQIEQSHEEIWL